MAMLEVSHLGKSFGRTEVLRDLSFTLEQGQALAIIGPSGSGKTTLLRCLNFLEAPDRGSISVAGQTVLDTAGEKATERDIRARRLRFGLVLSLIHI